MVYSVQRHAARNLLPKMSNLQESDATGGPTLLPAGATQAFAAGVAFRQRYLNQSACGNTCLMGPEDTVGKSPTIDQKLEISNHRRSPPPLPAPRYGLLGSPGVHFHAYNSLVRSSGLDRTISTARAFTDGAFPSLDDAVDTDGAAANATGLPDGEQVVPVYSLGEDPLIRAYTQCPAYAARLQDWYASPEFGRQEAATAALRGAVAAAVPALNTSLANWYNVWDGFLVNREYGVGNTMPALSDTDFTAMQDLAYYLETAKMRSNLTSNLIGGLLLGDLVAKLGAAQANATAVPAAPYHRWAHVSSHYNGQLGLLAALAVDSSPDAANITWLRQVNLLSLRFHCPPPLTAAAPLLSCCFLQKGA